MSLAYLNLKPVVAAIALWAGCSVAAWGQGGAVPMPGTGAGEAAAADLTDEAALLGALAGAGDPAEARHLERQLQALWSRSGSASMDLLLKRGREALENGETRAAIEHLTALTDHAPDFAEGWYLRASAYYEAGLVGPALADLGRALTLNPNNYEAIFGLGSILESLDDIDRAEAAYARVLAIHPHNEDAARALERLEPRMRGKSL